MAKFQKGSRVIREDTQRKGVISQVFDEIRGRQIYLVTDGLLKPLNCVGVSLWFIQIR